MGWVMLVSCYTLLVPDRAFSEQLSDILDFQ